MIIKLIRVRLAFPALFKAEKVGVDGDPRFSAAFPIDPSGSNAKLLDKTITEVATAKWGPKADTILADIIDRRKCCFAKRPLSKNGDVYGGFQGMYTLNASNQSRPGVFNRDASMLTEADGVVYAGCYVDAEIDIWAQDNSWGQRINATLRYVQFRAAADAFSGPPPVDPSSIQPIAEGAEADDLI